MRISLIFIIYIANYMVVSIVIYTILAALHVAVENPKMERILDIFMGFGGFVLAGIPTGMMVRRIGYFRPYLEQVDNLGASLKNMPSPAVRIWAMFFDGLAIIALFFIFSRIYLWFDINGSTANIFAVVFIFLLYEPLCVTLFKGTLGHYLQNFRIVNASGGRVNILIAFARFFIKSILGIFSFVLWFLGDKRALQDILTNTRTEYH